MTLSLSVADSFIQWRFWDWASVCQQVDFLPLQKGPNMFMPVGGTRNNDSMHKKLPVLLARGLDLELGRQQSVFGTWTLAAKVQVAAYLVRTSCMGCSKK